VDDGARCCETFVWIGKEKQGTGLFQNRQHGFSGNRAAATAEDADALLQEFEYAFRRSLRRTSDYGGLQRKAVFPCRSVEPVNGIKKTL
jgi:hypothetical protein